VQSRCRSRATTQTRLKTSASFIESPNCPITNSEGCTKMKPEFCAAWRSAKFSLMSDET
jgi:hypothetical protein